MAVTTTNLGVITAYGDAVAAGYTGTKAEWQTLMASYATVGQQAVDAKNAAVAAKDTAVSKATEATTAANTATTKAGEASASAQSIAQSASQITQNTSDISELKEDLFSSVFSGYYPFGDMIFAQGVFSSNGYENTNDRISTDPVAVNVGDIIRIDISSGYKAFAKYATKTGSTGTRADYAQYGNATLSWVSDSPVIFECTYAGYLVINVALVSEGIISPSVGNTAVSISFETKVEENSKRIDKLNEKIDETWIKHTNPRIITNGMLIVNNGEYSVYNSEYWKIWAFDIPANVTFRLNQMLGVYSSLDRVHYAITDNTINSVSEILTNHVLASYHSTTSTDSDLTMHLIASPSTAKTLLVSQSITSPWDPFITSADSYETTYSANQIMTSYESTLSAGTHEVGIIIYGNNEQDNIIVNLESVSNGGSSSIYSRYSGGYLSTKYELNNSYHQNNEFRFPRLAGFNNYAHIFIDVPVGATITINSLSIRFDNTIKPYTNTGVRQSAHLGFYMYAPENTMASFIAAYKSGYPACIANPKITSDGIFVCCHDSDISRTARNADGTAIGGTVIIENTTYANLLNYDFGIAFSPAFKGEKIPTLEDFLRLCGRTGMMPVFSVHYNFTESQWIDIRNMLNKFGVLKSFTVKGNIAILNGAYEVFSDDIYAYVYDVSTTDADAYIAEIRDSDFAQTTAKIFVEFSSSALDETAISKVLDAGYYAGMFDVFNMSGANYNKWINAGITEIVDDANCSYGLNW